MGNLNELSYCFLVIFITTLHHVVCTDDLIPQFVIEPQSIVAHSGMPVELSCSVSSNLTTIQWLLNGSVVASQRQKGIEVKDGSLKITSFDPDASLEGVYQCLATTAGGGTIISGEGKLEAAVLQSTDSSQTVAEISVIKGNVAVVPCYPPFSRPQAVIEFEINGTRLALSDRHMVLPSGNLQISDVKEQDRGMYQCTAYNPVIGRRLGASVIQKLSVAAPLVNVTPTFIWSSRDFVTVVLGHNLTLECAAEGWPVPELTWEKYGGQLPSGRHTVVSGNLLINRIQRFDAGTYLCRASNNVGQPQAKVISVEILESPVFETTPLNQNVTEGSTVVFHCVTRGTPKVMINWLYNANPLSTSNSIAIKDSTLTLTNIQRRQRGMYQCIAKNTLGTSHASARLTVTESEGINIEDEDDEDEAGERSRTDQKADDLDESVQTGENTRHRSQLMSPSKPDIIKLSESTVLIQWSILPPTSGHMIAAFKLQFKELLDEGTAIWRTVGEDILPSHRTYELSRLRNGSTYRFRVGAVYSNGDSKYGVTSNKVSMMILSTTVQPRLPILPAPVIVDMRPLSVSEMRIDWRQLESEQWSIDGFYIYYAALSDSTEQRKVVKSASKRHETLSHLNPGTTYRVRMQSFSSLAGESEFSKTFVKETIAYSDDGGVRSLINSKVYPSDQQSNKNIEMKKEDDIEAVDVEEYMPGGLVGNSDAQFLYIALGIVFGLVALVTIVCIITCMIKQHRQQQLLACAKERKSLEGNDPNGTFHGTMMPKPGQHQVNSPSTKSHIPGCNGACSMGAKVSDCRENATSRENLSAVQTYDTKISMNNGKMIPELLIPPPPSSSHLSYESNNSTPKNYKGGDILNDSEMSLICQQQQQLQTPSRCVGHIYSKLHDNHDMSSKSSTPSCGDNRMSGRMYNSPNVPEHQHQHQQQQQQHLSPDHIPRSFEHPQYWAAEQVRRMYVHPSGRGSAEDRMPSSSSYQSPAQSSCRSLQQGGGGWRREDTALREDEEEENNSTRDQATNTDLTNDILSLCADSEYNHYSSLERHDSVNDFSPGTSVVRDSFISVDSDFSPAKVPRGGHHHQHGIHSNGGPPYYDDYSPGLGRNKCDAGHQTPGGGYRGQYNVPSSSADMFRDSLRNRMEEDLTEGQYHVNSGLKSLGPLTTAVALPRHHNYPSDSDGYR